MKRLMLLSDHLIGDAFYKILDSRIFHREVSIKLLEIINRKHSFFRKVLFNLRLFRVTVMVYLNFRNLTLIHISILQLFYWKSIECDGICGVVKFAIVNVVTNSHRKHLRHMLIVFLLSD